MLDKNAANTGVFCIIDLMRKLIIIPGLGNFDKLYWLVVPWWWLRGYFVKVVSINWQHNSDTFSENYSNLLKTIDGQERVFVIGCSAGGVTACLSLLDKPNKVTKIAVIASPITKITSTQNQSLQHALDILKTSDLTKFSGKILSLFGSKDGLVKLEKSKLEGAKLVQIASTNHARTIAYGLTTKSAEIHKFFSSS